MTILLPLVKINTEFSLLSQANLNKFYLLFTVRLTKQHAITYYKPYFSYHFKNNTLNNTSIFRVMDIVFLLLIVFNKLNRNDHNPINWCQPFSKQKLKSSQYSFYWFCAFTFRSKGFKMKNFIIKFLQILIEEPFYSIIRFFKATHSIFSELTQQCSWYRRVLFICGH